MKNNIIAFSPDENLTCEICKHSTREQRDKTINAILEYVNAMQIPELVDRVIREGGRCTSEKEFRSKKD